MKKLFLTFIASAMALPVVAQTTIKTSNLPSASALGDSDVVVGVQSGTTIKATMPQVKTYVLGGNTLTSVAFVSPGAGVVPALGNATNGSGGILTFGGIGSVTEAWNAKLDTLAGSNPLTAGTGISFSGTWPSLTISSVAASTVYATASGSAIYTATPSPALTGSYATGLTAFITFSNANTGGASLNLNGLGAAPIHQNGAALTVAQISAGATLQLIFDGTNFNIVGNDVSASAILQGGSLSANLTLAGNVLKVSTAGDAIVSEGSSTLIGTDSAAQAYLQNKNGVLLGFNTSTGNPMFNGHSFTNASGQLLGDGSLLTGIPGLSTWLYAPASDVFTASAGQWVNVTVNTNGQGGTIDLPASPPDGAWVAINDTQTNGVGFATDNIALATTDGSAISGSSTLTQNGTLIFLVYDALTVTWYENQVAPLTIPQTTAVYDGAGNVVFDGVNRLIKNSAGATIAIFSGGGASFILNDASGIESISTGGRNLIDSSVHSAINWQNRTLNASGTSTPLVGPIGQYGSGWTVDRVVTVSTPTTGATLTGVATAGSELLEAEPTGTLAALTIDLESADALPVGSIKIIALDQVITSCTVVPSAAGGGSIKGTAVSSTTTTAGQVLIYNKTATGKSWRRIQ